MGCDKVDDQAINVRSRASGRRTLSVLPRLRRISHNLRDKSQLSVLLAQSYTPLGEPHISSSIASAMLTASTRLTVAFEDVGDPLGP